MLLSFSVTAFPHSNCRIELSVKTIRILLRNNVGSHVSLEVDKFRRGMLQYKNTPDPETKPFSGTNSTCQVNERLHSNVKAKISTSKSIDSHT